MIAVRTTRKNIKEKLKSIYFRQIGFSLSASCCHLADGEGCIIKESVTVTTKLPNPTLIAAFSWLNNITKFFRKKRSCSSLPMFSLINVKCITLGSLISVPSLIFFWRTFFHLGPGPPLLFGPSSPLLIKFSTL